MVKFDTFISRAYSLFPTMPRHNYARVAPLVRALCERHGVPYVCKTLPTAVSDIYRFGNSNYSIDYLTIPRIVLFANP